MANTSNELARVPAGSPQRTYIQVFPPTEAGGEPISALVKTTNKGVVKSVMTRVRLDPKRDETYEMSAYDPASKKWVRSMRISAAGYHRLNSFLGVSFILPETLRGDDNDVHANPYVERDERGYARRIRVRRIGIYRNPVGNLVAYDYTYIYDLGLYLARDFYSKWTGKKSEATKSWGRLVPDGRGEPTDDEKVIQLPSGDVLMVKISHKDVVHLLAENANRHTFALPTAITNCERNILKKIVSAAKLDSSLSVPIVSWMQTDQDLVALGEAASRANVGEHNIAGETISVQRDSGEASIDEVEDAIHCDADESLIVPEDDEEVPGVSPNESPATHGDRKIQAAHKIIREKIRAIGDMKAINTIIGSCGFESVEEAASCSDIIRLDTLIVGLTNAVATSRPKDGALCEQSKGVPQ